MKKQLLLLFAVLLAIAPAMSQSYDFSATAPTGQTLYYKINGSNATVTYPSPSDANEAWYGFTRPTGALTIPSTVTYNGTTHTVSAIGDRAFYYCSGLTSISFPSSVTFIGERAFYNCDGLTSLSIPSTVTSIGSYAFYDCSNLTTVNIPNGITTINNYCFAYCYDLSSITIPSSVTSINYRAFYDCTSIASITIPDGVTSIGSEAFHNATNIDYNGSATGSPWGAISLNGTRLVNYDFADDAPSGQTLYYKFNGNNAAVTYPGPSSSQTWNGFTRPTGALTIPSTVTYNGTTYTVSAIGDHAFYYCSGLTSLSIPSSVTSIGERAFYNCDGLTSLSIPSTVTSIGSYAFYDCSNLTTVNIPNGITTINNYCFAYCYDLSSITIPSSVTSINYRAFYDCTSIASITVPDGVTSIGSEAFYNVTNIDYNGIATGSPWGALSVNGVRIINYDFAEVAPSGQTLYYKINGTEATVTYPGPSSDQTWTGFTKPTGALFIPGSVTYNGNTYSVTAIGDRAFCYCSGLTSISFPSSVTSIGERAFYNCDGLTSLSVPSSVTSIGSYAFYDCSNLTTVNIPDGITTINNYCFAYCYDLSSVTIPSSVTSINYRAFYNCSGLQEMTVSPTNPPSTGSETFYHVPTDIPVYLLCGRSSAYSASSAWSRFTNFHERPNYSVTVLSADNTMGTVGIQIQPTCQSDIAVISATPRTGYSFVQWNDGNTDNPRTLTVTHDITLTAIFSRQQVTYPITLVVTPDEAIAAGCTVNGPTSYTSMLNNVIPNGDFESGTLDINITYTDNTAYNGHYEYGPDFGVDSSWGIYMDGALSYNVYFLIDTFAINPNHMYEFSYDMRPVEGSPPIIKTIINDNTFIDSLLVDEIWQHQSHIFTATSDSAIIQMVDLNIAYWGNDWFLDNICLYDLTQNAAIFTFTEAGGYEFVEWYVNDTYAGNGDTLYLTPDTATTVEARFSNNNARYTVTLNANNDTYGTVSGGGTYAAGATATLTATPNCGCWFTHWEDQYGNVLGAGTLTITVNSDATYTAVFEAVPTTNIQLQCSTGQTLVYSLDCNNSTATLTGYVGTPTGVLEIPSSISYYGRSYNVTRIDDLVFYVCRQITSVTIPNYVTTIGSQAFLYCNGLTSLYIPASVNEIGNYAFMGCGHLETIIVSDSNTVFDSRNNCNALIHTESNTLIEGCCNTVIPNDVVRLGYGAFHSSTLRSIVIPNSVVDMSIYVFSNCDNLTSIVVADGNPVFDSRDNCNAIIQTSTNTLVSGCKNTVIPNTVTSIGPSAFAFCNAMTTVTIPSSITYIANEGFRECRNLTSITCLATTPPTLDQESFYQSPMNIPVYVPCGSLASYQAAQWWSDFTNIQDDCGTHTEEVNIRTCTGQTLRFEVNNRTHTATVIGYVGQCNGGLTIPAWFSVDGVRYTVTAIGPRAFENCRGLESVTLPVTITLVDEEAFKGCSALIEVDMK